MDYQNRIPVANFRINGGERGLIFKYESEIESNEVWLAFYGLDDYSRRVVSYSDINDLIDVDHYDINVDLRDHKNFVNLKTGIDFAVRFSQLRAISFSIGESRPQFESLRLKKQMHVQEARLVTDPKTGSGNDFFAMMTDFVNRHANGVASTDDFRRVANEYFARTQLSKEYGLRNLDWFFFIQWVYHSELPSYQLEYQLEDQPGGKVLMSGTVIQQNVPDDWFMLLPLVMNFSGKQRGVTTVKAYGPKTPFKLLLP
jgi:hypothetical protein